MKRLVPIVFVALAGIIGGCSRETPTDPTLGAAATATDQIDKQGADRDREGRWSDHGMARDEVTYEVTIENLTPATAPGASQPFSPPVLATHNRRAGIFERGRYASPELAQLAEDAINAPLVARLEGSRNVHAVTVGDGVILPGAAASYLVRADVQSLYLSGAFMLVNTNDGFGGLNAVGLPLQGERQYMVYAWDAGSEANTELASDIPGPCCGSHETGTPSHEPIRRHAGIRGGADLDPAVYGWDGAVARVTVRRLQPAWEVTITNLTPPTVPGGSQVFSPPVLASHDGRLNLFSLRGMASDEISAIARDGDTAPMVGALAGVRRVADVVTGDGPILPGASATYLLEGDDAAQRFSLAFMLVNTNDGFGDVPGYRLPMWGSASWDLDAWDAGTELNSELMSDIPGPCCGHPHAGTDTSEPISLHAGIQGIGDLSVADYGWTGPVATVMVTRVR